MPVAALRGQRICFQDTGGKGLPVVLSHGFLMDGDMFASQVHALRARHRVVTWDQRGHGGTESTEGPYSYWDSAADLAALLDHLGIERAVLGGMSQGGFVSLRFALSYPERTAGLILIDTQAGTEDPEKSLQYDMMHEVWVGSGPNAQLLEMVAAIIVGNQRPESAEWIARWNRIDPRGLTRIYRTLMDRDDITDRLGEITAPALVIHGAEDVAIDMSLAETMCRGLRGCEGVVRIEGAGHSSNVTHPEPVNRAIESFLTRIESAAAHST
ncbi:MAG TPA: alpha/beta hydrolase [Candidatus Dormibacteraeota bacterium]|nr:alpha/beta hydrolase [Candidatus Dormibacteraeota bacterium]